jgi:phosphate transport system protein
VVARFYERIGDHAVNVGERTNFLLTGWVPESKGAARFKAKQESSHLNPPIETQ